MKNYVRSSDAIKDGGAMVTVIGWSIYPELSYILGTNSTVLQAKQKVPKYDAFGILGNSSKVERILGRFNIPLLTGYGR